MLSPVKRQVHSYVPKNSTNVAHVEWNSANGQMNVRFKSGTTHAYDGVPEHEFRRFVNAPSAGQHFANAVKGRYPSRKLGT